MRFQKHESARCPRCRRQSVWFGIKEEPTGWKILAECGREVCGHQWKAAMISRVDVSTLDDVSKAAEELL